MKNLFLKILILTLSPNIFSSLGFGAKDPWDCFVKILTEPVYMTILLKLDEKECETNVIDLNTMFRDVNINDDDSNNIIKHRHISSELSLYLNTISEHTYNLQTISEKMIDDEIDLEYKIPTDDYNNAILSKVQLSFDFRIESLSDYDASNKREQSFIFPTVGINPNNNDQKVSEDLTPFKVEARIPQPEHKMFDFGYDSEKEKENAAYHIDVFTVQDNVTEMNTYSQQNENQPTKKKKKKFQIKTTDITNGVTDNNSDTVLASDRPYINSSIKNEESQKKSDESIDMITTDEKPKVKKNVSTSSSEVDNEQKKDDIKISPKSAIKDSQLNEYDLFMDVKDFDPSIKTENYPIRPMYPLNPSNSRDKDDYNKAKNKTIFAIQSRLTSLKTVNTKELVIKALHTFLLLPKCIQSALSQCNPNMNKVVKTCERVHEKSYNKNASGANKISCMVEHLTVKLQCNKKEDLINNACYTRCPPGFKDVKLFCMKSFYIKRNVMPFKGQNIDTEKEIMWGKNFVVQKCSVFGPYYEDAGIDYCRPFCPPTFKDQGMLCEKPVRFRNQPIFTFDESFIDND